VAHRTPSICIHGADRRAILLRACIAAPSRHPSRNHGPVRRPLAAPVAVGDV